MDGWQRLRDDLRRIAANSPEVLVEYPDPDSERSPDEHLEVALAAWATDIADMLHARHGALLGLRVGAMSYPGRRLPGGHRVPALDNPLAQTAGIEVAAPDPLSVRTGRFLGASVLVTNHTARRHVLYTNGRLQAAVTDACGRVVGEYAGPQHMPLVTFAVEPRQRREVPVLIGTDSVAPDLGYAVPPGRWWLVVRIPAAAGEVLSAPLELSVTE